mmetsp:Transcript_4249/g.8187  ORF Transcript_4249/g.8187 Transcript_4249/m.8187 type:complete len:571 (-) Transcript_4249:109-1821(-)
MSAEANAPESYEPTGSEIGIVEDNIVAIYQSHHEHHDVQVENPELPPPMEGETGEEIVGHHHHHDDVLPPPMEGMEGEAGIKVEDPLANLEIEGAGGEHADVDQEEAALDAGEEAAAAAMEAHAAAEAAEACLGNVLDDVGVVDVHPGVHHEVHHAPPEDIVVHPEMETHMETVDHHLQAHHQDHHESAHVATEIIVGHHHAMDEHEPTPVAAADHGTEHHMGAAADYAADDGMGTTGDEEIALAAAAAAAAVQAADGMAVVVDQALLATAAAAAASQVAEVLAEHTPHTAEDVHNHGIAQDVSGHHIPPPLPDVVAAATQHMYDERLGSPDSNLRLGDHGDLLEQRRQKDRKRYSAMTPEARASYNAHRRELYHKQGEAARKRRRERERDRYHSLEGESKKSRNERRAKLERDRYNRLSKDDLASRNSKRRDRAKTRKIQAKSVPVLTPAEEAAAISATATIPPPPHHIAVAREVKAEMFHNTGDDGGMPHLSEDNMVGDTVMDAPLPEATVDVGDHHAMADASALAAEVAEQVIAGTNLDGAMQGVAVAAPPPAVHDVMEEEGPTVQI